MAVRPQEPPPFLSIIQSRKKDSAQESQDGVATPSPLKLHGLGDFPLQANHPNTSKYARQVEVGHHDDNRPQPHASACQIFSEEWAINSI